ncbi:hypothetical protein OIU84_013017 [Salix udensis]|uniref:Uncharacterized protein n=1 Tax=Salix udensis TaxID=889485 RepID=A0AAD6JGY0_9ROSI|nr:hypothetical protein OIU84_013017 [Salix udensis]
MQVSSLDIRGHGHTSKDKLPAQTTVSSLSSGKDGFDYAISAGSTSPVKLSVVSFFICAFILEAASSYFVRPLRQASTALSIPWKFVFVNICSASNKCNFPDIKTSSEMARPRIHLAPQPSQYTSHSNDRAGKHCSGFKHNSYS